MQDVEQPGRTLRLPLVAARRETLHELSAPVGAAERPPLDPQIGEKRPEGQLRRARSRHQVQRVRAAHQHQLPLELRHPPDLLEREPRHEESTKHGEGELEEVGGHDTPQAGETRVDEHENGEGEDGPEASIPGKPRGHPVEQPEHLDDLPHRQHHVADGDAVDRYREEERPTAAQHGGRPAAVSHLGQLHIGHHLGPAPEAREDVDEQHVRKPERPPLPVAGDAPARDEAGHVQRSVHAERRGRHGGAGQPPRERPSADEEVHQPSAGPPGEPHSHRQGGREIAPYDDPVDQVHARSPVGGYCVPDPAPRVPDSAPRDPASGRPHAP